MSAHAQSSTLRRAVTAHTAGAAAFSVFWSIAVSFPAAPTPWQLYAVGVIGAFALSMLALLLAHASGALADASARRRTAVAVDQPRRQEVTAR
jgi:hypothetical protein